VGCLWHLCTDFIDCLLGGLWPWIYSAIKEFHKSIRHLTLAFCQANGVAFVLIMRTGTW
jgi:hypothetical protein